MTLLFRLCGLCLLLYGIGKAISKVVISYSKIELSRCILTSLPKPAQELFLRPEIASFLVKISFTSKS